MKKVRSTKKSYEKSYEKKGARLHMTHQSTNDSPAYKIARTDIFIKKKKICKVRAGSVKLKVVQSYELGQS